MTGDPAGTRLGAVDVDGRMRSLMAADPPRTALDAVSRIRIWRSVLQSLSGLAEAQIMEACWVVRREHPSRARCVAWLQERAPELDADRCWSMALAWDAARRHRPLRDLAATRGGEAARLVRSLVDAGAPAETDEELDDVGREVVDIMSSPASRRTARLREMVEHYRASRDGRDWRAARDRAVAERDALAAELADRRARPAARLADAAAELEDEERELAALRRRIEESAAAAGGALRDRLILAADRAIGHLEAISAAAMGEGDDGDGHADGGG